MPMSPYYQQLRKKIGNDLIFNPAVAAVIHDKEGRVLCVKVKHGAWGLPAGAIEMGETPAQAVIREVAEETGLLVEPITLLAVLGGEKFRWTYQDGNAVEYVIMVFRCQVKEGILRAVDGEVTAFEYRETESLNTLSLPYPLEIFDRNYEGSSYFDHRSL
ncbi:NUDIX domain-containing protein [Sulfobacillus thermosulfidooxidans]|uniref:NUDIX domain-containing protein n=1 Tax=Sulfobacillus thermosulfidooxidans TaxID=28034 RepID=UPI0006B41633|nr:NUDIX domain-containing protein [Sulfobacillus thermosulfidooxidans]